MSSDDGLLVFSNDRREVELDGAIVVIGPIAADKDVAVVLLDKISVPLNHEAMLK